jgi:hypothetical protein
VGIAICCAKSGVPKYGACFQTSAYGLSAPIEGTRGAESALALVTATSGT